MENSNLTQPTNKEITLSSKDIKKKPNYLKLFTLLMLPVLVLSIGSFVFYFFLKARVTYIDNPVVNNVLDNSISKEQAEAKNLAQQVKRLDTIHGTKKSILLNKSYNPVVQNSSYERLSLEIDANGEITKKEIKVENVNSYKEVFYLSSDTLKNLNVDSDVISKNIVSYVKENNLYSFSLDVSFTYLPDYMDILEKISSSIKDTGFSIYLYPKWGDEVDYSHFATITNDFHKTMNLEKISKLVAKINVMTYDYTGPKDILPGPVTPTWWFERTIQYYIISGVPREKLIFGVNRSAYEWKKREIEVNPIMNYSLLNQEATQFTREEFLEYVSTNTLKPEKYNQIQEDIYRYAKDGVEYISIIPSDELIESLIRTANSYGVYGIYYK